MPATKPRGIPLTDEALRRKLSYNQLLRLVLVGKVRGWKEGTRWMVESTAADADSDTPTRTAR